MITSGAGCEFLGRATSGRACWHGWPPPLGECGATLADVVAEILDVVEVANDEGLVGGLRHLAPNPKGHPRP
jgi:hypothetical protein